MNYLKLQILVILAANFISSNSQSNEVDVLKNKSDRSIQNRIVKIVKASKWYPALEIRVEEGLVFIEGEYSSVEKKVWVHEIIERTAGVVALIDKAEVSFVKEGALSPAEKEVESIILKSQQLSPYLLSSIALIIFFLLVSLSIRKITQTVMAKHTKSLLIAQAVANLSFLLIMLVGVYLALKASGLSGLAYSVVGGTGALGLGLGLALKPTFENYISGLLISVRDIFRRGEIVKINNYEGVVQAVTTRGTTLMDYEGNNVILPNIEVASATIKNLTRNPKMRCDFLVGIGYDDSIDEAREVILNQLKLMPQIIQDPIPMVMADGLGAATVNLKVYFWFDAVKYSQIKMRSLVIQYTKVALMAAEISMPDDAREVVFTSPLEIVKSGEVIGNHIGQQEKKLSKPKLDKVGEPDLKNEIEDIKEQAQQTGVPDSGENLLGSEHKN